MADNNQEHFHELLKEFDTAMLVTRAADGELRARPMAIADTEPDGDVWFVSGIDTAKVDEIQREPRVNVSLQAKDKFLSVSGVAEIVRDRAKIDEMWQEDWKIWYPGGKDDPNIALLRVRATEGEYWDLTGENQFKFLFEAAKAYVTGKAYDERVDEEMSQKVDLGGDGSQ